MQGQTGILSHPQFPVCRTQSAASQKKKKMQQMVRSHTAVCTGLCLFCHNYDLFHSLYQHLQDKHNLKASEVPDIYWNEQEESIHLYCRLSENPDRHHFLKYFQDTFFLCVFQITIIIFKTAGPERKHSKLLLARGLVLQQLSSLACCRRHGPVQTQQACEKGQVLLLLAKSPLSSTSLAQNFQPLPPFCACAHLPSVVTTTGYTDVLLFVLGTRACALKYGNIGFEVASSSTLETIASP